MMVIWSSAATRDMAEIIAYLEQRNPFAAIQLL